jgi:hypothetical protein
MGDMAEYYASWNVHKRALRFRYGINCPECAVKRPKAHPSILLPQQVCKVDGYKDPRPRLTKEQHAAVKDS